MGITWPQRARACRLTPTPPTCEVSPYLHHSHIPIPSTYSPKRVNTYQGEYMITKKLIRLFADSASPYYQRARVEQDYLFTTLEAIGEAFSKEPSSWGADGEIFTNDFDDLTWEVTQDDTHIVIDYSYIKAEYEGEQERTEGTLAYLYGHYTLQVPEKDLLEWVDSYTRTGV